MYLIFYVVPVFVVTLLILIFFIIYFNCITVCYNCILKEALIRY